MPALLRTRAGMFAVLVVLTAVGLAVVLVERFTPPEPSPAGSGNGSEPTQRVHPMIPLLTLREPAFVPAEEAWSFLEPGDLVVGLREGGEARTYPQRILDFHETVNDVVGGRPVLVTWCSRCLTTRVYSRAVDGQVLVFRSPGLMWQQNGMLQDEKTGTLWLQATGEALKGDLAGKHLASVPFVVESWSAWVLRNPDSRVLSDRQGSLPREAYRRGVAAPDPRLEPSVGEQLGHILGKYPDRVLGVVLGGEARAYRLDDLSRGPESFRDRVGGVEVFVSFNHASGRLSVETPDGRVLQVLPSSLKAWTVFYPGATVYESPGPW